MPSPPRWNSSELVLADVAAIGGFKVQGVTVEDYAGFNFGWGDFNGDGLSDLIICSDGFDGGGLLAGGAFVIYGKATGIDPFIDLANLSADDGFVIQGEFAFDLASRSIAGAGDVNGDGVEDLFIGAFKNDEGGHDAGAAYIIYGRTDGFDSVLDLYDLDLGVGVKLVGEDAEDYASFWVASAGDVNGDGRADMIMGAPQNGDATHGGAAYVIFGRDTNFTGKIDLGALDAATGFKITGAAATDLTGYGVSSAGDINNDGFADLIVGAPQNDSNGADAGLTYVLYGRADIGAIDLATLTPDQGFVIRGEAAGDYAGYNVFTAGDVNGDGFDDIIIGAPYNDAGGDDAGAAYVVFGHAGAFPAIVDLAGLDGTNGFKIQGEDLDDEAGACVATAGDVNGDGYADLLVGSWMSSISGTISGAAYVLFGGASFAPVMDLSGLDPRYGLRIRGEAAGDITGRAVSAAGDMNGDGYDDLAVGSPWNAAAGSQAGAAYVIYGRPTNTAPTASNTTLAVLEDATLTFTTADFGFSDVDGDHLLTVTFTSTATGGGTLMYDADGDGPGAAIAVTTGMAISAADVAAGRLTFITTPNLYGPGSGTLTFRVQDDGGLTARGVDQSVADTTLTLNITSVNDLPQITALDGDHATFVEDGAAVWLDVGRDAAVSDLDSADFAGGTLRVEITGNLATAEDVLSLDTSGDVAIAGTAVLVEGVEVGTLAGGAAGAALVITFGAEATLARVSSLLEALTYRNTNTLVPSVATREITVSVSDGDGVGQATAVVSVDVSSTFDPAQAIDDGIDTDEASAVTGSVFANNGSGADMLADATALAVVEVNGLATNVGSQISLASGALLTVQADGSFSYDPNHAFDSTPAIASGASNAIALDSFTYRLDGGSSAVVTVRIAGLDSNDTVYGTAGNDTLTANLGVDQLYGLAGDDTYIVNSAAHGVFELAGGGIDTIRTTVDYALAAGVEVERLEAFDPASTAFLILRGNELANTIRGNAGINSIVGGGGADTLIGLGGDDSYVVAGSAEVVVEEAGGGNDTVYALGDYALASAARVETLLVYDRATTNAQNLTGNGFANTIHGNAGANVIDGGGGTDYLIGNAGNDTFIVDSLDDFVIELAGEGNDTVIASGDYALPEGMEIETLRAADALSTAAVALTGNKIPNLIIANAGANLLDGKGGGDELRGLAGDDTYVVRKDTDRVVELADQGYDTVRTLVNYALAADTYVEELRAFDPLATTALQLTGNGRSNGIYGNAGSNTLDGGLGADSLYGLRGNDTYIVDNGADLVFESAGQGTDTVYAKISYELRAGTEIEVLSAFDVTQTSTLVLFGNEFGQTIYGNNGASVLKGGGGADVLYGMGGNDAYFIDGIGDTVNETVGGGYDVVYTTDSFMLGAGSEVELITVEDRATANAVNLSGNAFAQTLFGNAGSNVLDGGGGADVMYGFTGDDVYVVDNAGDWVVELAGQGFDTVNASVNYALGILSEVEVLSASDRLATTALNLAGSAFDQSIYGNNGVNFLNGCGGADVFYGLGGDDAYLVDDLSDRVIEAAGEGTDTVYAIGHFALTAGSAVEVLSVYDRTTTNAINLAGNDLANTIYGNAGSNVIDGKGGADAIYLMGGIDKVYFSTPLGPGNVDSVIGFTSGEDKLQLDAAIFGLAPGGLSADAFVVGNAAQDAADRLVYNQLTGQLSFDADGSGAGAAVLFATLGAGTVLGASDFLVV